MFCFAFLSYVQTCLEPPLFDMCDVVRQAELYLKLGVSFKQDSLITSLSAKLIGCNEIQLLPYLRPIKLASPYIQFSRNIEQNLATGDQRELPGIL